MNLNGKQSIPEGYKEKVCIVCTDSNGETVQEDNMELKQESHADFCKPRVTSVTISPKTNSVPEV